MKELSEYEKMMGTSSLDYLISELQKVRETLIWTDVHRDMALQTVMRIDRMLNREV